jgi:hypothetical protein
VRSVSIGCGWYGLERRKLNGLRNPGSDELSTMQLVTTIFMPRICSRIANACAFRVHGLFFIAILAIQARNAGAVCLDANLVSGFHEPLEKELAGSVAVIVGEPLKVRNLSEDPSDPSGWTARVYRVQVLKVLRGNIGKEIDIRDENDSGRFGLDVGKRYLLFVGKHGANDGYPKQAEGAYFVSSCGSSGLMSESTDVLRQLGLPSPNESPDGSDGLSEKSAVVIQSSGEVTGIRSEYKWISDHYPGSERIGQALTTWRSNGKRYDKITIRTNEGRIVVLWFEISSMFK